MATPTAAAPDELEHLAASAEAIEVPKGFRVEIIEGKILVSPTPTGLHALLVMDVHDQIRAVAPSDLGSVDHVSLSLASTSQRYVPDLVVCQRSLLDSEEWLFPAAEALLVMEVTSPRNAEIDREIKPLGYASEGVEHYLLIDRQKRLVTLSSGPENHTYQFQTTVPFGKPLALPEPFAVELDTTRFK
ncbi:Uma2 family endonuclease [Salinactinospora qingdaonensis]|uniref:Uma2 family endonuclease n=1 Tax=Salinactinospora qingdaonensis TaxID=702744 RepID=A0ABP7EZT5_9ACTN